MDDAEYRRMAEAENAHWWYGSTRQLLDGLLSPFLGVGGRYLDAGHGTGATGTWLQERGGLVGTDFELQALQLSRVAHPQVSFASADVQRLPFPDNSFDAVLCVTVLCHRSIADPVAATGELARVLRPAGVICLMEPGVRRLRRAHDRVTHTGRRFARRDLSEALTRNGIELLRATGAYSFLLPAAIAKSALESGRAESDLDRQRDGLRGILPSLATLERRVLRHADIPIGLSVIAIGRKPSLQRPR
jgi:SAM-dependent methyltransferase